MRQAIFPLDRTLSTSLDKSKRPETILDQAPVNEWLAEARELDDGFYKTIRRQILHQSLGFGNSSAISEEEIVSPPPITSVSLLWSLC